MTRTYLLVWYDGSNTGENTTTKSNKLKVKNIPMQLGKHEQISGLKSHYEI